MVRRGGEMVWRSWLWLVPLLGAMACFSDEASDESKPAAAAGGPANSGGSAGNGSSGNAGEGASPPGPIACYRARSYEPLPARANVMNQEPRTSEQQIFVDDLFGTFKTYCGGCHVEQALGGFKVSAQTFAS